MFDDIETSSGRRGEARTGGATSGSWLAGADRVRLR